MSVPLDRLYHYLADCVNHDLLIYGWKPHGSRKLEDLDQLFVYQSADWYTKPMMIFHDQEPLNYNLWSKQQIKNEAKARYSRTGSLTMIDEKILNAAGNMHLRGATGLVTNQYDLTMLAHSEQCSPELSLWQDNHYVPVYFWSHALIAHDWFRYAEHDPQLNFSIDNYTHDFLIYNRSWSGTREYRLVFADMVVSAGLTNKCKMKFNCVDQNQHYRSHVFTNSKFKIRNTDLQKYFEQNHSPASSSADYNSNDYATSGVEVILETLFDDTRWHITEKTLRAIACGKPFILAATPHSLDYLKLNGFKTFHGLLDETYDSIDDPTSRLEAIVKEMLRISQLELNKKQKLYNDLYSICQFNKKHFFRNLFQKTVNEYKTNIEIAIEIMQQNCTGLHQRKIQPLLTKSFG